LAAEKKKTLVIAEKPSVALDITRALPEKFQKEEGFYEGTETVVSYAIGHLVGIANPKAMDDRFKQWSLEHLPFLPEQFAITPIGKTKGQLNVLAKLLKRKDIKTVINGCDAGREGELIFRYIVQYVSETKPIKAEYKRLWLQSMTKTAILDGFQRLREEGEMANLAAAAQCRSEADWLVGINGSRALTGYKSLKGGFFLTPCGRVQTPTLSMVVRRERDRDIFVSKDYWEVDGHFRAGTVEGPEYSGRWIDPQFKKSDKDSNEDAKPDRIWDEAKAKAIAAKCKGKVAEVSETSKPSSQSAPGLYDLTSLQRDGNGRFGFSARTTLSIAQALYEKHKVLTYPRTDSRYLPEDYVGVARDLMRTFRDTEYGKFAAEAIDKGYVKLDKRIFDNTKVSDHFAIIPTNVMPGELSDAERRVYNMVVQRFLAVFFPPARYHLTTRLSVVEGETFKTEGKVLEDAGWRAIYGIDKKEESMLPPLQQSVRWRAHELEVRKEVTKPPPRLTESTLLSFMESAGKYVDDEELSEALKERGLGTPATRAAVIEGLIEDKYIVREGKELIPTAKGNDLLKLLEAIGIEELTMPELTGEWEFKLNRMEKGLITRPDFMQEIKDLTRKIVSKIKAFDEDRDRKQAGFTNPIDGKPMYETLSKYESDDGKMVIRKVLGGREMSQEEVLELLTKRRIGPISGFRSKMGKPFTAAIRLTDELKVEFVFEDAPGKDGEGPEILNPESLGTSPMDGSKVFETLTGYLDESAMKGEKKGFKMGKMILGKPITREHISKMLAGEKTELIQGFQSAKTRRFFDAFLKLNKDGSLAFEFPPREFKGKGKKGKAKEAASVEPAGAEG
jgi:DNA topoisomerase III